MDERRVQNSETILGYLGIDSANSSQIELPVHPRLAWTVHELAGLPLHWRRHPALWLSSRVQWTSCSCSHCCHLTVPHFVMNQEFPLFTTWVVWERSSFVLEGKFSSSSRTSLSSSMDFSIGFFVRLYVEFIVLGGKFGGLVRVLRGTSVEDPLPHQVVRGVHWT